jgi:hypothetical protein
MQSPGHTKRDDHTSGDRAGGSRREGRGRGLSAAGALVFAGIVGLGGGAAGAWAYSHFVAGAKSGEPKPSGKAPDAGRGADSAEKDSDRAKLQQAKLAWTTATKELRRAREAEKDARASEQELKAILQFLEDNLLAAGRAGDVSLPEAFWSGGTGRDLTLRKAVDLAESRIAESFADRPLAEATVRELLGRSYLGLGAPSRAVGQYERALALREAIQGAGEPETAACRNQLAVANRLAGRAAEAGRLFDRNPNSPSHASALAVRGALLLADNKPADAELALRECLTIRQKNQAEDWTTFETSSMLGEALAAQQKYADAEPLLVAGYEGMKRRQAAIPAQDKPRLTKALKRLVMYYEVRGMNAEAARWRDQLESPPGKKKS